MNANLTEKHHSERDTLSSGKYGRQNRSRSKMKSSMFERFVLRDFLSRKAGGNNKS
jgi:hypothetical protein